jgi:hypothetical protein
MKAIAVSEWYLRTLSVDYTNTRESVERLFGKLNDGAIMDLKSTPYRPSWIYEQWLKAKRNHRQGES